MDEHASIFTYNSSSFSRSFDFPPPLVRERIDRLTGLPALHNSKNNNSSSKPSSKTSHVTFTPINEGGSSASSNGSRAIQPTTVNGVMSPLITPTSPDGRHTATAKRKRRFGAIGGMVTRSSLPRSKKTRGPNNASAGGNLSSVDGPTSSSEPARRTGSSRTERAAGIAVSKPPGKGATVTKTASLPLVPHSTTVTRKHVQTRNDDHKNTHTTSNSQPPQCSTADSSKDGSSNRHRDYLGRYMSQEESDLCESYMELINGVWVTSSLSSSPSSTSIPKIITPITPPRTPTATTTTTSTRAFNKYHETMPPPPSPSEPKSLHIGGEGLRRSIRERRSIWDNLSIGKISNNPLVLSADYGYSTDSESVGGIWRQKRHSRNNKQPSRKRQKVQEEMEGRCISHVSETEVDEPSTQGDSSVPPVVAKARKMNQAGGGGWRKLVSVDALREKVVKWQKEEERRKKNAAAAEVTAVRAEEEPTEQMSVCTAATRNEGASNTALNPTITTVPAEAENTDGDVNPPHEKRLPKRKRSADDDPRSPGSSYKGGDAERVVESSQVDRTTRTRTTNKRVAQIVQIARQSTNAKDKTKLPTEEPPHPEKSSSPKKRRPAVIQSRQDDDAAADTMTMESSIPSQDLEREDSVKSDGEHDGRDILSEDSIYDLPAAAAGINPFAEPSATPVGSRNDLMDGISPDNSATTATATPSKRPHETIATTDIESSTVTDKQAVEDTAITTEDPTTAFITTATCSTADDNGLRLMTAPRSSQNSSSALCTANICTPTFYSTLLSSLYREKEKLQSYSTAFAHIPGAPDIARRKLQAVDTEIVKLENAKGNFECLEKGLEGEVDEGLKTEFREATAKAVLGEEWRRLL